MTWNVFKMFVVRVLFVVAEVTSDVADPPEAYRPEEAVSTVVVDHGAASAGEDE